MCGDELKIQGGITLPSPTQLPSNSAIYRELRKHCIMGRRHSTASLCTPLFEVAQWKDFQEPIMPPPQNPHCVYSDPHGNERDSFGAILSLVLITSYLEDGWQHFSPMDKNRNQFTLCTTHLSSWAVDFSANADKYIDKVLQNIGKTQRSLVDEVWSCKREDFRKRIKELVVTIILGIKHGLAALSSSSSKQDNNPVLPENLHANLRDEVQRVLYDKFPHFLVGNRREFIRRFSEMLAARLTTIHKLHDNSTCITPENSHELHDRCDQDYDDRDRHRDRRRSRSRSRSRSPSRSPSRNRSQSNRSGGGQPRSVTPDDELETTQYSPYSSSHPTLEMDGKFSGRGIKNGTF